MELEILILMRRLDGNGKNNGTDGKAGTDGFPRAGKSALRTFLSVFLFTAALGTAMLLLFVYVALPAIISRISDFIDDNFARELYRSTLVPDDGAPAFGQTPAPEVPALPRDCYSYALSQNPDVAGRIRIEGAGIYYLVLQADNNEKYLKTGYSGEASDRGAIFLDHRCDTRPEALRGHYIIYGHNARDGTMFHNLTKYKDSDFFYANRTIRFDTLYKDCEWEIFSVYVTDIGFDFIRTDFSDGGDWLSFLREIQSKSLYETDTVLRPDDVVLTLCTCTNESDDTRLVLHARLAG